ERGTRPERFPEPSLPPLPEATPEGGVLMAHIKMEHLPVTGNLTAEQEMTASALCPDPCGKLVQGTANTFSWSTAMNTLSSRINPMTGDTLPWEAHRRNWHAIRETLNHGRGYVIVKGFPVADRPEREISADLEALVSRLGTVTAHGASRQTIWRITPRPDLAHVPTFS